MPHTPRPRRSAAKASASIACSLAMLSAATESALAADATQTTAGLHISTGALVDPAGRTWVTDHNAGFCRVTDGGDDGPGHIEHPEHPGSLDLRTCLGGLLPNAGPGPDAAGQPTFYDPSPEFPNSGDELAFVPDGASPSSEVVRAKWNPATKRFAFLDTVTMQADRGRPVATTLGPDERIYVTFQRETTIQAIDDLDAPSPTARIVGQTSDDRGAAAIAATRDADGATRLWIAESVGLRTMHPGTAATLTDPAPEALTGPGGVPATVSTLASDLGRNLVWAGTADGVTGADAGIDRLLRIDLSGDTPSVTERAKGFSMIGGLGVRPNGQVDVVDDPALLDPAEPLGTGRMFRVGLPVAHVTDGPLDDEGNNRPGRDVTSDTTPTLLVEGEGALQCRFAGPGRTPTWQDCPENGILQIGAPLTDGEYVLSVKSTVDGVTGLPEAHRFRVDTKAPLQPVIVRPADGTTVSGTPWFEFTTERGSKVTCRFTAIPDAPAEGAETAVEGDAPVEGADAPVEAPFVDCAPGRTEKFDTAGTHKLEIKASDRAGNVSEASVPTTFTVDPSLPPTPPPGFGNGLPAYSGSSLFGEGLHISAGALVDPNGRVWVSDHNGGFCRMTEATEDGPGQIEHPQLPTDLDTPRTCLGGLLPFAGTGPDAAGQPTLVDPTPAEPGSGDEIAMIPDGASPSSDVVRAKWNPDNGLFEYLDAVVTINDRGRGRPTATTLGPDGNVYVVFQRETTVQQITDPAGENPSVRIVANTSDGRGSSAVAATRDAEGRTLVYVSESTGITEFRPLAGRTVTPVPASIPGLGNPAVVGGVSSMVSDLEHNHLWLGTADAAVDPPIPGDPGNPGADQVHRVRLGDREIDLGHAKGYSMVGGLGLRSDGVLYVMDDPALLDAAEPLGMGRMFQVGRPAAHVVRGPVGDDGREAADRGATRDRTPQFEIAADAGTTQCRLKGDAETEWAPCTDEDGLHQVGPLEEGSYRLLVRAVDGEVTGLTERHAFRVDRTAPDKPRILSPASGLAPSDPWFEFDSEPGATIECRWNESDEFVACDPGLTRSFPENGDHSLQIRAIDRAGNVSEPSDRLSFTTRNKVNGLSITAGPEGHTNNASPTFAFKADPVDAVGVQYGCRLSGEAFALCSSPRAYSNLDEGTYVFEVRALDSAGNQSPVKRRSFTVDTTLPVISFGDLDPNGVVASGTRVALSTNEEATLRCSIDGGALEPCGPSLVLDGLGSGEHKLRVVATDRAGNERDLTRTFSIEAPADPVAADAPAAAAAPVAPVAPAAPRTQLAAPRGAAQLDAGTLPGTQRITIPVADRQLPLADLRADGIQVTVTPPAGARVLRFRIFRIGATQAAAAKTRTTTRKAKPVTTLYRTTKGAKKMTVQLRGVELRKLRPGKYRLEMQAGKSTKKLGKAVTRTFTVTH